MIQNKNGKTIAKCAKRIDNAKIAVGVDKDDPFTLKLRDILTRGLIVGKDIPDDTKLSDPVIEIDFSTVESVDVYINALAVIRKNLENHYPNFALAC